MSRISNSRIRAHFALANGSDDGSRRTFRKREALERGLFTRMFIIHPKIKRKKAQREMLKLPTKLDYNMRLLHFLNKRKLLNTPAFFLRTAAEQLKQIEELTEKIACYDAARRRFTDFADESGEFEELELLSLDGSLDGICGRWMKDAI